MSGSRASASEQLADYDSESSFKSSVLTMVTFWLLGVVDGIQLASIFIIRNIQRHFTLSLGLCSVDSVWNFGQVVAPLVFVPVMVDLFYTLFFPPEQNNDGKDAKEIESVPKARLPLSNGGRLLQRS